jgi:hypothetical protein
MVVAVAHMAEEVVEKEDNFINRINKRKRLRKWALFFLKEDFGDGCPLLVSRTYHVRDYSCHFYFPVGIREFHFAPFEAEILFVACRKKIGAKSPTRNQRDTP